MIPSYPLGRACAIALCLAGLLVSPSFAGPNQGGMLLVHVDESIVYSRGVDCDVNLRDCAQAVTSIQATNPDRVVVLFVMASFPFSPSLAGVAFGVEHTTEVVEYGLCLRDWFELRSDRWPESGSGTALVVASNPPNPIRDRLFSLYWFAVYAEYGGYFAVTEHPTQPPEEAFADESIPAQTDEIAGFGWAGFGQLGYNPCLEGVPVGACCLTDGRCVVTTDSACRVQGGVYRGDNIACDAFACVGPCCYQNECTELSQVECDRQGGEWAERPGASCHQVSCLREHVTWGVLKHHHRY